MQSTLVLFLLALGYAAADMRRLRVPAPRDLQDDHNVKDALLSLVRAAGPGAKPGATSVESLVKVADVLSKQDPSTLQTSIAFIRQLISGMIDSITSQVATTQAGLNDQSTFTQCSAAMQISLNAANTPATGPTTTTAPSAASAAYTSCVQQLNQLQSSMDSCTAQQTAYQAASDAQCTLFRSIDSTPAAAAATACNAVFSGSYEDYMAAKVQTYWNWVYSKGNCSAAQQVVVQTSSSCQKISTQVVIQEKQCSALGTAVSGITPACQSNLNSYNAKKTACSTYASCYQTAVTAAASAASMAKALLASQQAEYLALMRVICLLDAISTSGAGAVSQDQLQACITKTASAASLNIVVPGNPAALTCDPGMAPTC